jgi:hypothetical protein
MTSHNPFKSKTNNSRFSRDIFFNDEQESFQVKEKKHKSNEVEGKKADNTFLVDKEKKIRKNSNNYEGKSYTNHNYNKYAKNDVIKEVNFDMNIEEFPELISQKKDEPIILANEKKFSDIVKTINIIEENNNNIIRPGWIIITKNKESRNTEVTNGEMTEFQKKQELSQNMSYIMRQIDIALNEIWDRNVATYDKINGEGAYEETFYLPPVYDDFEDYGEEDEIDENNNNDFYNDENISDIDYHSDYY